MYKLDYFDKVLLYELDKDASAGLGVVAKKVKRSKQFVLYRMKKLEEAGVITGYHAIVDMSKLGYFTFRMYLDLKEITESEKKEMIEYVRTLKGVWTITTMSEKWDLAIFVGVKSVAAFHQIREGLFLRYKEKIKTYNVSVYAPIYNFNRRFFLNTKELPQERVYRAEVEEEVGELDLKLIEEYARDVRESSLELSKKLGVSADTIRAHLRLLEKRKIIVGYKLGLNLELLGYHSYRVDLELKSMGRYQELFGYCRQHHSIYQINKTIGGADFEIEVIVKDKQELILIIDELKKRFAYMIFDVDYFGFSTFHVLKYIPD